VKQGTEEVQTTRNRIQEDLDTQLLKMGERLLNLKEGQTAKMEMRMEAELEEIRE
jgi:hypothetical protein